MAELVGNRLLIRAVIRAAAEHARCGHEGYWRDCPDPLCRDAQNLVPPELPSARALARLDDPDDRRLVGLAKGGA